MSKPAFVVFNLLFISIYQNILLALIALPLYVAQQGPKGFNVIDVVSTLIVAGSLALETTADQQQWNFHLKKAAHKAGKLKQADADIVNGFLTSGLFKYSRHPNWFFEQCIWWGVYGYSIAATGQWLNYSVLGAFLLTLLFQGSVWITEMMSSRKYPKYAEYKKTTSQLIPWFPSSNKSKSS
jgi:steroid 5-alpha reductase family enzyme